MKKKRYPGQSFRRSMTRNDHYEFVNALRVWLGLGRLYGKEKERSEPGYGFLSIAFDDGNRRVRARSASAAGSGHRTAGVGRYHSERRAGARGD